MSDVPPSFNLPKLNLNVDLSEIVHSKLGTFVRERNFKLDAIWTSEKTGAGLIHTSTTSLKLDNKPSIIGMLDGYPIAFVGDIDVDVHDQLSEYGLVTKKFAHISKTGETAAVKGMAGMLGNRLGNRLSDNTFKKMIDKIKKELNNKNDDNIIIKQVIDLMIPNIPVDTGKLKKAIQNTSKITRNDIGNGRYALQYVVDIPEDRPIHYIMTKDGKMTVKQWLYYVVNFVISNLINAIVAGFKIKCELIAQIKN